MSYSKLHALVSRPLQIFSTVLILLIVLAAADGFIITIIDALTAWRYMPKSQSNIIEEKQLPVDELKQRHFDSSAIKFMEDGTIHFLFRPEQNQPSYPDYSMTRSRMPVSSIMQIYDANDILLWQGKEEDIPYQYLEWSNDSRSYARQDNDFYPYAYDGYYSSQLRSIHSFTPELSQVLELKLESEQGRLEFWRYNPADDLLVGFEARGPKIGYISDSGFTLSKTDSRHFGKLGSIQNFTRYSPFKPSVLWQTNRRLYEIDLQTRQVEVLFESVGADIENLSIRRCPANPLSSLTPYLKLFNENCRPFIDCIMTDGSHHLILSEPLQHLSLNIPGEWFDWNKKKFEITATTQGVYLHRSWSNVKRAPHSNRLRENDEQFKAWWDENMAKPHLAIDELYKVNENGSLQLISSFSRTRTAKKTPFPFEQPLTLARSAQTFLRAFSSPLYTIAWNKYEDKISNMFSNQNNILSVIGSLIISQLHPNKILPNILLSIAFILAAFWHGWTRRASGINLILWLIIVGTFNLAGFLAYLALNHTPVIKCPICGKKRGLEQPNCVRCGNSLPIPQRKPTDLITSP